MSLEIQDISVRLARRWVLSGLSFSIQESGALVMLTGDNGAGKSTLLRVIASVLKPQRGRVSWREEQTLHLIGHIEGGLAGYLMRDFITGNSARVRTLTLHFEQPDSQSLRGLNYSSALSSIPMRIVQSMGSRLACDVAWGWRGFWLGVQSWRFSMNQEPNSTKRVWLLIDQVVEELRAKGTTVVMATHEPEYWKASASYHVHLSAGRLATFEQFSSEEASN